ncbi:translin-associated protein X-like isoform X2 [Gigantopelta aegis]|uniref:translin-associated protein X-like isoform X2 n=1 Tax=Gigantopelta aegis TaxID=1735272 RepID=UPI001B8889E0|nr:translin-associated protein X-like isoform X2 [Gigantopelta aegis]
MAHRAHGVKRSHKGEVKVNESSPVIQTFRVYQRELDNRHDKYERIVKLSRDITIESKRIIFLLHRVTGADTPQTVHSEAMEKIKEIQEQKFLKIAKELEGEDPYMFIRAYSPGLQEYIEAVSFYHFLKEGSLVGLNQVENDLMFNSTESPTVSQVYVPPVEYMLGIADLTGELMRLTINSVGAGDLETPFKVRDFMQIIHEAFQSYGNTAREINKKMFTLRQSLQKVENACYTIQVRGSEIPRHMLADVLRQPVQCSDDNQTF